MPRLPEQSRNRLAVLKAIRRHAPLARTELPALTGLSGGTITQITGDLVRRGLVLERKDSAAQVIGRRRTHLRINPDAAVVIGATIGGAEGLTVAFVDLAGRKLLEAVKPMRLPRSIEDFALIVAEVLESAIADSPFERESIARIGMAMPGVADSHRGVVRFITTLGAGEVPFAAILEDRLGAPVTIDNNVVCLARAEHWFGNARELDTFTLVHVGHQVSAARYVDGMPQLGANGINGEFGHTKPAGEPIGIACYCDGHGCVTTAASIFGLVRRAGMIAAQPFPFLKDIDAAFARLLEKAEARDAGTLALFEDAGTRLGVALANYITLVDPGDVLIVLDEPRLERLMGPAFHAALAAETMPGFLAGTRLTFAAADEDWRWKGTAALALERIYLEFDTTRQADGQAGRRGSAGSEQQVERDASEFLIE